MTSEITLAPGEALFAEGSQGDQAYIIKSGEVEIFKTVNNRPVLLSVRGCGSVIGETALLIETPRNASVSARQESVLLVSRKTSSTSSWRAARLPRGPAQHRTGTLAIQRINPEPEPENGPTWDTDRRGGTRAEQPGRSRPARRRPA